MVSNTAPLNSQHSCRISCRAPCLYPLTTSDYTRTQVVLHAAAFDAANLDAFTLAAIAAVDRATKGVSARDMWLFGPPRGYWCFGYEAFNKVIKAGAQRSNWRDTTYSIMQYWSVRSARAMIREQHVASATVQCV